MSKLFTPRALLIQVMLYLISRAIFTLIKSEMKTAEVSTGSNAVLLASGSEQIMGARSETQELLHAVDGE